MYNISIVRGMQIYVSKNLLEAYNRKKKLKRQLIGRWRQV